MNMPLQPHRRWITKAGSAAGLLAGLLAALPAGLARADVAPDIPELPTVLPAPTHVIVAGVALSLVLVVVGLRMVRRGAASLWMVAAAGLVLGVATALAAKSSYDIRREHNVKVREILDRARSSRPRQELHDPPVAPSDQAPPLLEPPLLEPPLLEPPLLDAPLLETPQLEAP